MTDTAEPEDTYQPSLVEQSADRLVLLSGCSGGGKSTLLAELARRGHATFEEPGRQVVREQLHIEGDALPWKNLAQFVELTVSRSIHHMIEAARDGRLTFFDRGIVDQVSGLTRREPVPAHFEAAVERFRYRKTVFMTPPWPEIYRTDAERRHGFEKAEASYTALLKDYKSYDYRPVVLPKTDVTARADFVMDALASGR